MTRRILLDGVDGAVPAFVAQRLAAAFGDADVSDARTGDDVQQVDALRDSVRAADLVVTFVGGRWIDSVQDSNGLRRLLLTEAVLSGVPIAPVLVNETPLPEPALLPEELRFLVDGEIHRIKAGSTIFDSINEFINSVADRLAGPVSDDHPLDGTEDGQTSEQGDRVRSERADLVASVDAGWRHAAAVAEARRQEVGQSLRRLPGGSGSTRSGAELGGQDSQPTGIVGGSPPTTRESTQPDEAVRLGVSAPKRVQPDRAFVARLVAYPADQTDYARKLLRGPRSRSTPRLDIARCRWPDGARIEVRLGSEHLAASPPSRSFVWQGDPIEAAFSVVIPAAEAVRTAVLGFEVIVNGIPLAHPVLEVDVGSSVRRRLGQLATLAFGRGDQSVDFAAPTSAFASYSSKDRNRVLDAVVALQAIGIEVFTGCLDIRAGEEFKTRIAHELLERDLYVLFWSDNARESKWVAWELETVLEQRGEDPIRVNPLEPNVEPPSRLRHLNFNSPGTMIAAYSRLDA